jgi:hypothetical protein
MHDANAAGIGQTLAGLLALAWCAVLFLQLAGWGAAFAAWFKLRRPGLAIAAGLGLIFESALGGLLNLAHLVDRPLLLVMVIVGFGLWLVFTFRDRAAQDEGQSLWWSAGTFGRIFLVLTFLLIGLHLFSFIRPMAFNQWDDLQAYLVLPWKMLQVHHLAADPFSQRRVINSVGSVYFLQAIFLTLAPLKNIKLVDGGLGVLLLAAAALDISRVLGLSRWQTLWFFLLAGLTKQIAPNLSFSWLPCGFYLVMVLVALREDFAKRPVLQALLIGGLAGANTGLKNNHVVCSILFVLCLYAMQSLLPPELVGERRLAHFGRGILFAAVGALCVLLPWMIDLKHYSGTYFFPILGHGYEYTTYHLLPTREVETRTTLIKCFLAGAPILLLAAVQAYWARWNRQTIAIVSFTLAAGLSIIAVALATGGDSIRRYTYSQSMAALLLLLPMVAILYRQRPELRWRRAMETLAVGIVLIAFVSDVWQVRNGLNSRSEITQRYTEDFVASWNNEPLNTPAELASYHAAQASIPPGAVVIENATYGYLFDNTRNTIYEASLPAMASPPPAPGWPILSGGEALAAWLQSHGVRYLIYSYGDEARQETEVLPIRIADLRESIVVRATQMAALKANHQFLELSRTRRKTFDDGMLFVLDLATPAQR